MFNKTVLVIVFLLLLISLVAPMLEFSFVENDTLRWWASICYCFATLIGGYLLVQNSDIRSTIWWRFMSVAIGMVILGVLFKILHYTGADELLLVGCGGLAITYLIRFISKRTKNHLDVLKVLTVLSYGIVSLLVIFHIIPGQYNAITKALFWATIVDFAYLEWRSFSPTSQKK